MCGEPGLLAGRRNRLSSPGRPGRNSSAGSSCCSNSFSCSLSCCRLPIDPEPSGKPIAVSSQGARHTAMTDNDTITISKGRPNRQGNEKDFSGSDGVYQVILGSVSDPYEADSRFSKTGKGTYRDFTFIFENPENEGE